MTVSQGTVYPAAAEYAGWALTGLAVAQIPVWFVHSMWQEEGGCLAKLFTPNKWWGPARHGDRLGWLQYNQEKTTPL